MSADSSPEHANSYTVDTGGPIKKLVANITGRRYRSAAEKKVDVVEHMLMSLQTKVNWLESDSNQFFTNTNQRLDRALATIQKMAGQVSDLRVQLRDTLSASRELQGSVIFLMKKAEEQASMSLKQQEQIEVIHKVVLRLAPTMQK